VFKVIATGVFLMQIVPVASMMTRILPLALLSFASVATAAWIALLAWLFVWTAQAMM
jgi:hypothetical protein